jgi:hypothetical protein
MDLRKPPKSKTPPSTASFTERETGYMGNHYRIKDAKPAEPAASRFPTKEQRQIDQDIVVKAFLQRLEDEKQAERDEIAEREAAAKTRYEVITALDKIGNAHGEFLLPDGTRIIR